MRVLQLIDSLDAGGAERMAVNLANTLSGTVERSYLCTTRQEGLLKAALKPEVSYLFLEKKYKFDLTAIKKLFFYIDQEQITIIHAHSTSFFMATFMKWLRPSLKIVWHDHYGNSTYLEARPYRVLKFCSSYFSMVLSVNTTLVTWSEKHLKCKSVFYLANFASTENAVVGKTSLKGASGKRILCLANLRDQKDHPTLLKAFKVVHEAYPDWTLHCVGQDFKDAYSDRVYALVKELHLENHVYFYGSCPDSRHIIEQSTIGVLSSASEGMPLTLLEYGLGKLPIVATDVGDCYKVFPKGDESYLIAAGDIENFAAALIALIADEERRIALGNSIYHHILDQFSESAVAEKLVSMYAQL